jgi:hypothetical protein
MNNYSTLQRFLHRSLLSSKFMREIMFDVEQSIFLKKDVNYNNDHVFVVGLARSGTTILLNAIYQSNKFASLTYDDMPFILAPNLWKKISPKKIHGELQERAHGDSIRVSSNSPEAFEEVFWKTFSDDLIIREELFIKFILLILKKNNKTRYLSKNNQNIRRLDLISEIFPHSKILIPFRDPLQQALSLFSQHMKFVKKQNQDTFVRDYMKWIGHSEFGLDYKMIHPSNLLYPNEKEFNHLLEQWYLTYKTVLKLTDKKGNFHLIGYESLCNNPLVWANVKDLLGINQDIKFLFEESKKVIGQTFDNNLSDKCYKLYESFNGFVFKFCQSIKELLYSFSGYFFYISLLSNKEKT